MKNIINNIKAFIADENGAETIEWVMIVALLTVIILAVYNTTLNTSLVAAMTKITAHIATSTGVSGGGDHGDHH
ncbi:MAG: Flp family type IVb pilin [Methylococcaceae bacterium]